MGGSWGVSLGGVCAVACLHCCAAAFSGPAAASCVVSLLPSRLFRLLQPVLTCISAPPTCLARPQGASDFASAMAGSDKSAIVGSLRDMLYKKRMERQLLAAKGLIAAPERPPDEVRWGDWFGQLLWGGAVFAQAPCCAVAESSCIPLSAVGSGIQQCGGLAACLHAVTCWYALSHCPAADASPFYAHRPCRTALAAACPPRARRAAGCRPACATASAARAARER